jgi:hypothetical protein
MLLRNVKAVRVREFSRKIVASMPGFDSAGKHWWWIDDEQQTAKERRTAQPFRDLSVPV